MEATPTDRNVFRASVPGGRESWLGRAVSEDPAREAARSFVATALIQPVLKQLRQTNGAAEPFAPGAFEKQFAPLMDQIWSEQLVRASHWPLVDMVAQRLRGATAGGPVPTTTGASAAAGDRSAREIIGRRGWLG